MVGEGECYTREKTVEELEPQMFDVNGISFSLSCQVPND